MSWIHLSVATEKSIEKKKRLLHQATLVLEIKLEDLFVLFEFGP